MVCNSTPTHNPTLDALNHGACGISVSPEPAKSPGQACAPGRSTFTVAITEICDPFITRDVIARADTDFARIFGPRE